MERNQDSCAIRKPVGRSPRVLLAYPEIPDTYWSFRHALPFIRKKAVMPPLGLLTVAAMLPSAWELDAVDLNVSELTDERILRADLVMISAMIVQRESFRDLAARVKRLGVPIVAGGPYPTSCYEEIQDVDCFILNEGEITVPLFLADYESGTVKHIYTDAGRPPVTETPIPRFDLLDMKDYDTIPLQYSRGCPFDCEFCDIVHLFGHTPRTKSPEQFIREMDAAYATGHHGALFVVDDNFIGNKRRVKELLRAIIPWQRERGYPFDLSTEASINLAEDEELMDLMVEAGFVMVFVGIETPVAESLSGANKNQNLKRDIVRSVRKIQEKGIEVTGGFVIGFDTDPEDIFDRQIEFIRELAVPTAMVGLLMALPNTKLSARLASEGRLLFETSGNNTHETRLNFTPKLPERTLLEGYRRVLATIYDPRTYFDRCLELLSRLPAKRRAGAKGAFTRKIDMRELLAFPRSLFRQGFSFYGREYLRYLFKAVRMRPGRIVEIITMAIQGHHFITITRENANRGGKNRRAVREEAFKNVRNDGRMLVEY